MHALLPDGDDSQQSVLSAYAHLKDVVLRGGTNGAEGGMRGAETGINATVPSFSGRRVRNSEGINLTPSASLMPSSGSISDAQGEIHKELRARFVKTYEEKISWLHLFSAYPHV